jgi:hypothetical protein
VLPRVIGIHDVKLEINYEEDHRHRIRRSARRRAEIDLACLHYFWRRIIEESTADFAKSVQVDNDEVNLDEPEILIHSHCSKIRLEVLLI